jgi:hypothetical protein
LAKTVIPDFSTRKRGVESVITYLSQVAEGPRREISNQKVEEVVEKEEDSVKSKIK